MCFTEYNKIAQKFGEEIAESIEEMFSSKNGYEIKTGKTSVIAKRRYRENGSEIEERIVIPITPRTFGDEVIGYTLVPVSILEKIKPRYRNATHLLLSMKEMLNNGYKNVLKNYCDVRVLKTTVRFMELYETILNRYNESLGTKNINKSLKLSREIEKMYEMWNKGEWVIRNRKGLLTERKRRKIYSPKEIKQIAKKLGW
jgi:hypothetical protein